MNNLFETKLLCHKGDPETSHEAAKKMVESGKLGRQEQDVLNAIIIYKRKTIGKLEKWLTFDFTARELDDQIDMWDTLDYYTIQRRLSGLYRKGYIERTGEKRNGCCVWRLK